MSHAELSDYVSTAEACRILGCSRPTVLRLISTGCVHACRLIRDYRIDRASLETYLASRAVGSVPGYPAPPADQAKDVKEAASGLFGNNKGPASCNEDPRGGK